MGIFSKLKHTLTASRSEDVKPEAGKFAPEEEKPLDLKFVEQFTEGGGSFMYCTNKEEAHAAIDHYLADRKLRGVFISSPEISSIKDRISAPSSFENDGQFNAVLSTCEALIAFNGGIMIHGHHTGGRKLSDLPKHHIVVGYTTQIVANLRDGMTAINQKYRDNRPSHIAVIRAPHDQSVEMASADPNKDRTVFLVLIEDEI